MLFPHFVLSKELKAKAKKRGKNKSLEAFYKRIFLSNADLYL